MENVPKVLIIDDEPSLQKAIGTALKNEGYDLYFANNGQEGLKVFHEEAPELIFLDLLMPVMDGYEFLNSITIKLDSPFTIIVITGEGGGNEISRCYELGIDFFLKKPLSFKEICGLARRCIKLKRLERERVSLFAEVQKARDQLEQRVKERTFELSEVVASLEEEIREHHSTAEKLGYKTAALQESNIALQVLLKRRDQEKSQYDMELIGKIEKLIQPYLDKLKDSKLNISQKNFLNLIEQNLKAITSPYLYSQLSLFLKLSAKEIQVSNLIKQGMSTKEIASMLDISTRTVETHRYQIRKKIGLKGRKTNLRQELLKTY